MLPRHETDTEPRGVVAVVRMLVPQRVPVRLTFSTRAAASDMWAQSGGVVVPGDSHELHVVSLEDAADLVRWHVEPSAAMSAVEVRLLPVPSARASGTRPGGADGEL